MLEMIESLSEEKDVLSGPTELLDEDESFFLFGFVSFVHWLRLTWCPF